MRSDDTPRAIPLSQGGVVLVDSSDYDWLAEHRWYAVRRSSGLWYAATHRGMLMHRLIMQPPPRVSVDHINHDGLDNQHANLRIATQSQNSGNSRLGKNNHSGFKGVYWDRARGLWAAQITQHRTTYHLGRFSTAEEAAAAYDAAALVRYGAFAALNHPHLR